MVDDTFGTSRAEVEHAIEEALDHARACGDYRTAGELESILDGMLHHASQAARPLVH